MRRCRPALVLVFVFLWCAWAFAQDNATVPNLEVKGNAAINQAAEKTDIIIFLEVKGLKKYSDFLYLKDFLKKRAKMVKNIRSQSFQCQQVCLELEVSGTAEALAVQLDKTGRYLLDAEQIKKNQIVINLLQEKGE